MVTLAASIDKVKSNPFSHFELDRLPPRPVDPKAPKAPRSRACELDTPTTLAMFLQQILAGNVPLAETCHLCGKGLTPQAYCKARQRLPLQVIHDLFAQVFERVAAPALGQKSHLWFGHRTFHIDGSSFSMPDTPELRKHFGVASESAPGCGFPVAHLLVLFSAATGMLIDLWPSPMHTHDLQHSDEAHLHLGKGDILIGDEVYSGYPHLAVLVKQGLHGVFPMHHLRIVDFTRNRAHTSGSGKGTVKGMTRSRWVRSLGHHDQVVEYFKPRQRPARLSEEEFAALPESILVREIRRTVRRPTGQKVRVTILTTLLDAQKYPAEAIVELRLRRWDVETGIGHLKTTLKLDVLRCQSVEGVRKELAMIGLVYNLVRAVMLEAAAAQGVKRDRISFADAYKWMRHARPGDPLPKLIVNPRRPERIEPRCKKRRPKEYDLMNRPRDELRKRLKNQASAA